MKKNMLHDIVKIIEELKEYWPLTLRQIYYQLVSKELIDNKQSEYKSLSRLLVKAREDNSIDWDCMIDRTRSFYQIPSYPDYEHFIRSQIYKFADKRYYWRDMQQGQKKYIEVWIEKDALSSIFEDVVQDYSINLVVCKGYPSRTFLKDFIDRSLKKESLILYFGDLDPSGINIFDTTKKYFTENISKFDMKRYALTFDQINDFNLPHSPEAIKKKDTRTKDYIDKYGKYAVELDSLRPDILINIINKAILENLDKSSFELQQKKNERELKKIDNIKSEMTKYFNNLKL